MNAHIDGRLAGKVAIVTGASRGIGAGTAVRLAAEGARVALVARTQKPGERRLAGSLEDTADRIKALGAECLCIAADLVDPAKRGHIVPETVERYGGVDILIDHPAPAPFARDERYFKFNAEVGPSVYGSSKAALERLTTGMACELAAANIAVNAVAPVEAVASEGAIALGTIDTVAHMEPLEVMVQAVLELCSRPPAELSGRHVLSLPLLRELGATVRTLDARAPLAGFHL